MLKESSLVLLFRILVVVTTIASFSIFVIKINILNSSILIISSISTVVVQIIYKKVIGHQS